MDIKKMGACLSSVKLLYSFFILFSQNISQSQFFTLHITGGSHSVNEVVSFSIRAGSIAAPIVIPSTGIVDTIYYDPSIYEFSFIEKKAECLLQDAELKVTHLPEIAGFRIEFDPEESVELYGCVIATGGLVILVDITGKILGQGVSPLEFPSLDQIEVVMSHEAEREIMNVRVSCSERFLPLKIVITDISGRVCLESSMHSSTCTIGIRSWPAGVYTVWCWGPKGAKRKTILLTH